MTAALVASLEGRDVLLCETSGQAGRAGSNLGRHAPDPRPSSQPPG
ncbi:MAG TPA: hypothetical protein VMA30_10640 [Xanthobacteraceae bacterium]|nr:hypothetical protein [Xanthobacteraceae bacterium]